MIIANPIYDVVFRYLMNDEKVAKLILSALIEEEIVSLAFKSTEIPVDYEGIPTVIRMDFSAEIQLPDGGTKKVIIELQKAKYYLEIMRFRRYLGEQYADATNKIEKPTELGTIKVEGMPILPIYILGEKVTDEVIPVLRVGRQYIDVGTREVHDFRHAFMESLSHDSIFVQIPHLTNRRKTNLEKLLYVFDQSNIDDTRRHFLNIEEKAYPAQYRPVIRRLKAAMSDKKVVAQMKAEDDFLDVMKHQERELERANAMAEEERQQKEAAEIREEEERRQKEEERRQKEAAEIREKEAQIKLAKKMLKYGESIADIMSETGLSETEITKLG